MVTLFLTPLHLSSVKLKIYVQIFSNLLIFILKVVSFGFSKHYNQFLPYLFHCLVCLPEPTLSRLVRNLRSRDLTSMLSVFGAFIWTIDRWNGWDERQRQSPPSELQQHVICFSIPLVFKWIQQVWNRKWQTLLPRERYSTRYRSSITFPILD